MVQLQPRQFARVVSLFDGDLPNRPMLESVLANRNPGWVFADFAEGATAAVVVSRYSFTYLGGRLDRALLDFGRTIALRLGAGDHAAETFRGRITGLEGRFPEAEVPQIAVLAEDRLQDLRMTRRTRTFEQMTDRDVIQRVASGYGLQTQLDLDGPQREVVTQLNQSDLAFIRDVARRARELAREEGPEVARPVGTGAERLEADQGGLLAEERLGAQRPGPVSDEQPVAERLRRVLHALRRLGERVLAVNRHG